MADWRIVTPTRAPTEDEMEGGVIFQVPASDSTVSARISYLAGTLVVQLFFVDPQVNVRYSFSNNEWIGTGLKPIDITTVDLTIPEEVVAAATIKTSYFNLIAYEKGTTACKLAVANEAKTLIRNALINTGVDVPDTTPFRQYAGKIEGIETGSNIEILTFDIQPDDYENVSSWWDEEHMHEYTEALWHIQGPYVFKSKTYNSINELLLDVSANNIYFAMGSGSLFFQRPISIVDGTFKFISKDKGLDTETLYMIVNFGDGV